jgi:hypothetical protein
MTDDYASRLAEVDQTFDSIDINPFEGGTYQGIISRFDFFDSKKTGDVFLKTEIAFAHEPRYEGQQVEAIHNLTDSDKLRWTKRYFNTLGYEGNLSDILSGGLEPFIGVPVEFAIVYSDKKNDYGEHYMNVYINRRLGEANGPSPSDITTSQDPSQFRTTPVDDDDVPFMWIPVDRKPVAAERANPFA